jgi:lipoprotein NlpI
MVKSNVKLPFELPSKNTLFLTLVIMAVSFAVYFNVLYNGFVYDDNHEVLDNSWIRDVQHLPDMFSKNSWYFQGEASNYYRPFKHIFYMVAYYIFGLKPWGFHLVNVLFHSANSLLVFIIAARLLKERDAHCISTHTQLSQAVFSAPFIAAILFATHPIHTEAVAWVSAGVEVSYTFFCLLSLYFYMKDKDTGGIYGYLLSLMSFSFALLCKETALIMPIVLVAYDFAFPRQGERIIANAKKYVPFFLISGAYLVVRVNILSGLAPLQSHIYHNTYQMLINVFPLFAVYLEKLLVPINLHLFSVIHPIDSPLEALGIFCLIIGVVYLGFIVVAYRKNRVAFFCLAVLLIPLLPAFYIPAIVMNYSLAERYLYLPSVGFVILAGMLFVWMKRKMPRYSLAVMIAVSVLTGLYSFQTITRNKVWENDLTLFTDTVAKSPAAAMPLNGLGFALVGSGKYDEAIECFNKAIDMSPSPSKIYYNRGVAFYKKGLFEKAIADFDKSIALDDRYYKTYNNKGQIYGEMGYLDKALEQFNKTIEINPEASIPYGNRGLVHFLKGEYDRALEDMNKAIELDNHNTGAYGTRGNLYLRTGHKELAILDFQRACDLGNEKACEVLKQYVSSRGKF